MQTFSSDDTERNLAVELILEDIPGGGVIEKDDFPTGATGMKEGALVGVDSSGIYHVVKTAMLSYAAATNDASILVYEGHEFKVGDFVGNSTTTNASGGLITAVAASGAGCGGQDRITVSWAGAALAASGIIVAASGLGHSPFKYTPAGVATNPVDLTNDNNGCGIVVRGRVRQRLMPYHVDTTLKAYLPLIRFV